MQLVTTTFVKNKCLYLTISLQQNFPSNQDKVDLD